MSVQELALKTIAEIERRGWQRGDFAQGSGEDDTCKVCLMGGVAAALTGNPRAFELEEHLNDEYDEFAIAFADEVDPDWRDEIAADFWVDEEYHGLRTAIDINDSLDNYDQLRPILDRKSVV